MGRMFLYGFLLLSCLTACLTDEETYYESTGSGDEKTMNEETSSSPPPPPSQTPEKPQEEKTEGHGFDPCPSVEYVLLEDDGIEYTIIIEVFCEPIQNLNLGCPQPLH